MRIALGYLGALLKQNLNKETLPLRPTNEITSLTGLRGVAAVYVLLFHYFPLGTQAIVSPFARIIDHGYLAVDLFFVLSGFVMAMNYSALFAGGWTKAAYRRFLGRRVARIYPLYLVVTLAAAVLVLAGGLSYEWTLPVGPALLLNLALVQAWGFAPSFDSPAWSISAEWAAYLVFPALLATTMFRSARWAWFSALACTAALAVLCALPEPIIHDYNLRAPLNLNGYWLALPVLRCIPEFTLGILAFRFAGTAAGKHLAASAWIAPVLCVIVVALLALPKSDLAVVLVIPALVVSLAGRTHLPGRLLSSRPAEFLGVLSYSIYLCHKLAYGLLGWIYEKAHAAGVPHAQTLAAAICIALTVPLAYVAYRTIELPGRRWLRTLFEGAPAAGVARPAGRATANEA